MSLLMDALKKAEEAKRQAEAAKGTPSAPGTAEPGESTPDSEAPVATPAPGGLPELPTRLELLDHEFDTGTVEATPAPAGRIEPTLSMAPADPAGSSRPAAATEAATQQARSAAQNVFMAKQPASSGHSFVLLVGGATLLAVVAIGGWFWWQMQPHGSLTAAPLAARSAGQYPTAAPQSAAQPIAAAMSQAQEDAAALRLGEGHEGPAAQGNEGKAEAAPAGTPGAVSPALTFSTSAQASRASPAMAAAPAPAAAAESPIRITRDPLRVNPRLESAYQAYQHGDLKRAEQDYLQVLRGDPKNVDALQGLAAIRLGQGHAEAADALFLRILEADPKNPVAQAGLIGLRGSLDPVQSASRLKNLLASQPDSPVLNFALGNVYARMGQWHDAQQAYFKAYAADGENPDYQFNLAVSLDQLRQARLALQYYQGALAAAAQRPAAFDRNQAAGRIAELQK